MILIPATFLAGAILSLVLPVGLLIALVVWYLKFVRGVPETAESDVPGLTNPAPGAAPESPAPPAP